MLSESSSQQQPQQQPQPQPQPQQQKQMAEPAGPQAETEVEYPDLWGAITGEITAVDVLEQRGTINRTAHIEHLLTKRVSIGPPSLLRSNYN